DERVHDFVSKSAEAGIFVGREKVIFIKENSHRRIRDAKLLADQFTVLCEVFGHQDTNGIIKFRLEEIAVYNVDKSIGESSERLNFFRMLPELKVKVFGLLPKRKLLRISFGTTGERKNYH